MNELTKFINEAIKDGLTKEEVFEKAFVKFEELEAEDLAKCYSAAMKAKKAEELLSQKEKEVAEQKSIDERATVLAEKMLEEKKVSGIVEKVLQSGNVQVKENEHQWKKDVADFIKAKVSLARKDGNIAKSIETLSTLTQKAVKVANEKGISIKATSIRTDSDADGGYLIRPEFDMEMDKLVYKNSELLNEIKFRPGGDKTDIDSMGTFDLSYRTNQDTAFGETKPTFNQQRLEYREAGAIVPISQYALNGSEFNLVQELVENAADAKIRLMEFQVTSGKTATDPFDGIRFHAGVTVYDIIDDANAAGSGVLSSKDLTNAYALIPSQSKAGAKFVLDTRELLLLLEERDDQNLPIETVLNVNGRWVHKATGKQIIVSDLMSRVNNGVTANNGGLDINILCGVLDRFRIYEDGGMQMDQSNEIYFKENQIGLRFILRNKWGIPVNSRSSFVAFNGARNTAIS